MMCGTLRAVLAEDVRGGAVGDGDHGEAGNAPLAVGLALDADEPGGGGGAVAGFDVGEAGEVDDAGVVVFGEALQAEHLVAGDSVRGGEQIEAAGDVGHFHAGAVGAAEGHHGAIGEKGLGAGDVGGFGGGDELTHGGLGVLGGGGDDEGEGEDGEARGGEGSGELEAGRDAIAESEPADEEGGEDEQAAEGPGILEDPA